MSLNRAFFQILKIFYSKKIVKHWTIWWTPQDHYSSVITWHLLVIYLSNFGHILCYLQHIDKKKSTLLQMSPFPTQRERVYILTNLHYSFFQDLQTLDSKIARKLEISVPVYLWQYQKNYDCQNWSGSLLYNVRSWISWLATW